MSAYFFALRLLACEWTATYCRLPNRSLLRMHNADATWGFAEGG